MRTCQAAPKTLRIGYILSKASQLGAGADVFRRRGAASASTDDAARTALNAAESVAARADSMTREVVQFLARAQRA